jgi:hypothetical protein
MQIGAAQDIDASAAAKGISAATLPMWALISILHGMVIA